MKKFLIYLAKNNVNGKSYIGQTTQKLVTRMNQHRSESKRGADGLFMRAIRKHGWDAFTVEVLEECESHEDMNMSEKFWIGCYGSLKPGGYNLDTGGNSRKEFTAEARAKISASRVGKPTTLGRKATAEQSAYLSEIRAGVPQSAKQAATSRLNAVGNKSRTGQRWEKSSNSKLTYEIANEIRRLYKTGMRQVDIANQFGVNQTTVSSITLNKAWPERCAY